MSNRRVWGLFGETEEQARRREAHEAEHRRNRDAAGNARRDALEVEAERKRDWDRIQAENAAKWAATRPKAHDDSPEAVAARTAAAKTAGELEKERQRRHRALRDRAMQEAVGARSAMEAALNAGDLEAYAVAHARLLAFDEAIKQLDTAERNRRTLAATPILHGAARV